MRDPLADAAALLPGRNHQPQRARKPIEQRLPIIKPHDMQAFFGQWRAAILEAPDPERTWFDCAADFRRRVKTMEIGRAAAADELDKIIRDQSLFSDASNDDNQTRIAAALADPGPRLNDHFSQANGHDAEPPPPEHPDFGGRYELVRDDGRAAAQLPATRELKLNDPADYAGKEIPPREWLALHRIPAAKPTLLSGDGGTGKSTIALQLVVAAAYGDEWLGARIDKQGPAWFLSAEEDDDEIIRRLTAILDHQGRTLEDLKDRGVRWSCLDDENEYGDGDALLGVADRTGRVRPTPLYEALLKSATEQRPALIVVENAADVFAIDENNRSQVRQAVALLRRLAKCSGAAIVLISHPSLYGLNSGSGTSGSTQWSNAVRSRLYFAKARKSDDEDDGIRELKVMKANYGPEGEIVRVRWHQGLFVPVGHMGTLERVSAEADVDQAYLDCLDATLGSGRHVGPYTGKAFAPFIFAQMPQAKGHRAKVLTAAQERLFNAGHIEVRKVGPPSKALDRIFRKAVP